jgi:peptidoglycan/LPS O-acetylase OafA/YrhL
MTGTDSRLLGSDFVRAAACSIVLLHHVVQRMGWNNDLPIFGFLKIFGVIGGLGVAIFFVLSGFLLARPFWQAVQRQEPMPSLRVYWMRRIARIVPGFWLALTVTFVLSFTVFERQLDLTLTLRYLAGLLLISDWHWTSLFPVEINGPLWSIGFEVSSYAFLPIGFLLIFAASRRMRSYPGLVTLWLAVIAAALALHWLFVKFYPLDTTDAGWGKGLIGGAKTWMPRINPFGLFAIFAIGALAAGLQVWLAGHKRWLFDGLSLLALLATGYAIWVSFKTGSVENWGFLGVPYGYPGLELALGAFLALTPSSVLVGRLLDNQPIAFLARVSFGIYVWHYLILELVKLWWFPELHRGTQDPLLFTFSSAVAIAITVAIATVSFYLIENPIIRWAKAQEGRHRLTLSPAPG